MQLHIKVLTAARTAVFLGFFPVSPHAAYWTLRPAIVSEISLQT